MNAELGPSRLQVVHVDPDDGTETPLGEVDYGGDGMLSLVEAVEGQEAFLDEFVDEMNGQEELNLKVPGEEKFSLTARTYRRGDADFFSGLRDYARHYFAVALVSEEDLDGAEEMEKPEEG